MTSIIKILPLEIISLIIENLAGDEHAGQSLKACSLSCQTFLPLCHRELFRAISLQDENTKSTFVELVQHSPQLVQHVRELVYVPRPEDGIETSGPESSIFALLQRFRKLRSITIAFPGRHRTSFQDWQQLPTSMRSTLLSLMHLPLITFIGLRNIKNFDYFDFVPCTGLRALELHEVSSMEWDNSSAIRPKFPAKSIQLHKLKLTDQRSNLKNTQPSFGDITKFLKSYHDDSISILDLRGLTDVTIAPLVDLEVAAKVIKRIRCLETVVLGFSCE